MTEALSARELAHETAMPPLLKAVAIMRLLRSDQGCPWDREQTMHSLQRHTLEEVYEVFDAIDRGSWDDTRDELGDLLLQVLFYAQIADDAGEFDIDDVAAQLTAKLIRRHPHVFGEAVAEDAAAVVKTWDRVKGEEQKGAADGLLAGVPAAMPGLLEAAKLGEQGREGWV